MTVQPNQQNNHILETHLQLKDRNTSDHINFYDEYCRLFLANKILHTQLKQLEVQQQRLNLFISKNQKKSHYENSELSVQDKKKRIRRTAVQIQRHYQCKAENCFRSYGSQGSLNQHLRYKHPELVTQGLADVKEQESIDEQEIKNELIKQ